MSTIRHYPGISHFLGSPTDHVIQMRRGHLSHSGVGQAFWFRRGISALSEVPATDQELPALVHAVTQDQQDMTVQVNVTYRFTDPALAAQRLDFAVWPARGLKDPNGRQQVANLVAQLVQSVVVDATANLTLAQSLATGIEHLRGALEGALLADTRLAATGLAVLGVRVLAVRPEAEVEQALQTPVREQLQAEADRATYERRALAVERERAIAENELANQIELAARREQLVAQEGVNQRREADDAAAVALIASQGEAERQGIAAQAKAAEIDLLGQAEATKESALMAVYASVGQGVLMALALRDAAGALPAIGNLTITPDLVTGLLGQLTGRSA